MLIAYQSPHVIQFPAMNEVFHTYSPLGFDLKDRRIWEPVLNLMSFATSSAGSVPSSAGHESNDM